MEKKEIHIAGWSKDLDIASELSDNYDLDARFDFENESIDVIKDCFIRIWNTKEKSTLEEAKEGQLRKELGDMSVIGQETGYSEYTIMGFDVYKVFIGNHNLQAIISDMHNAYLHIVITQGQQ